MTWTVEESTWSELACGFMKVFKRRRRKLKANLSRPEGAIVLHPSKCPCRGMSNYYPLQPPKFRLKCILWTQQCRQSPNILRPLDAVIKRSSRRIKGMASVFTYISTRIPPLDLGSGSLASGQANIAVAMVIRKRGCRTAVVSCICDFSARFNTSGSLALASRLDGQHSLYLAERHGKVVPTAGR